MAQTLRSQMFEQMNRDVQSGISSLNSSIQGLAQAKDAYDKTFESKIEQNINIQLANYQREIDLSNDPDAMGEIQKRYEEQMASYLNDIKAPASVRKKFNEQTSVALNLSMTKYREDSVVPMMWKTTVAAWEDTQTGYITQVGSNGDMNYSQKKAALEQYWEEHDLANAPYKYVGNITTVDDALKQMEGTMVSQFIDREYASLQGKETANDFLPEELAERAVSDLENQKGAQFDVSTRADLIEIALKRIKQKESTNMENVQELQNQFTLAYQQRVKDEGTVSQEEMLGMAAQYGAINPDGSLNRYWTSWFASNMDILQATSDYQRVMDNLGFPPDESKSMVENAIASFGTGEPVVGETTGQGLQVPAIVGDDGSFNWSGTTGTGKYTFPDGSYIETNYKPMVEHLIDSLNVSRDSKDAVTAIVNLVEAEGAAGRFDDANNVRMIEDLLEAKYNPNVTKAEYQNKVMGYVVRGLITEKDASDLDLWGSGNGVDTKQFQSMAVYKSVESEVGLLLEQALDNRSLNDIRARKIKDLSPEEERTYNNMKQTAMQYLERQYNSDPSIFEPGSAQLSKVINEAIEFSTHKEISKQVEKALSIAQPGLFGKIGDWLSGNNKIPYAERTEVQTVVTGFYDTESPYHAVLEYLTGDIQGQVNSSLLQGYKNLNDAYGKAAEGVYSKEFNSLDSNQQIGIKAAVLRVLYEKEFKKNVCNEFGLTEENSVKTYIAGKGPAFVDVNTGKYYATDGDPNTLGNFLTGTLSRTQLDEVLKQSFVDSGVRSSYKYFTVEELTKAVGSAPYELDTMHREWDSIQKRSAVPENTLGKNKYQIQMAGIQTTHQ